MLELEGDVLVESSGVRLRLEASGSTLVASLEGPTTIIVLRRLRRAAPLARRFVPLLVRAGLSVEVFAGKRRVARAGAGIVSNAIARALGLANVRIGK